MAEPKEETIQSGPAPTSPLLQPLPKPPGSEKEVARPVPPIAAEIAAPPLANRGPKNEIHRVSILPRAIPKTQPLSLHPDAAIQPAPMVITSRPVSSVEAISRPLCWALLGISALIFLIQIWNYVVS